MNPSYYNHSMHVTEKGLNDRIWNAPSESISGYIPPVTISQVGYAKWGKGCLFQRNYYKRFGIELIIAGNARFIHDGKEFIIQPGQAYLKHPGNPHHYETGPAGFLLKRFVTLSGPKLDNMIDNCGLSGIAILTFASRHIFISRLKQAADLIRQQPADYWLELSSLAYRIMIELGKDARLSKYPSSIASVLNFMQQSVRWWVSAQECAQKAGMSVPQLYRVFEQHLGMAPMAFFRHQKIKFAQDLLINSNYSIKQIAQMLCYDDPFYFSTQFKKISGMSPRDFRKNRLNIS